MTIILPDWFLYFCCFYMSMNVYWDFRRGAESKTLQKLTKESNDTMKFRIKTMETKQ